MKGDFSLYDFVCRNEQGGVTPSFPNQTGSVVRSGKAIRLPVRDKYHQFIR